MSSAVTVNEPAIPAVDGLEIPVTTRCVAAPGCTVTVCEPVIDAVETSVALTVCEPGVRKFTPGENVWLPASAAVNVEAAGRSAAGAVTATLMAPADPVAV